MATPERPTIWFRVGTLCNELSVDLETELNSRQPKQFNHDHVMKPQWKLWTLKLRSASWAGIPCILPHNNSGEGSMVFNAKDNESFTSETLLDCAHACLPLASSNLYLFPKMNNIHWYNSLQGIPWVFLVNYQIWGWFWETPKLTVDVRSEDSLGNSALKLFSLANSR